MKLRQRGLVLFLILLQCTPSLGVGFDASVLPRNKDEGNVREYFASNRQKRFLLRVQVWGDVPSSGIYYVPDNSTLLDVLGYAGGPNGFLTKSEVTLNRVDPKTKEIVASEFPGTDLVMDPKLRVDLVREGDVMFVDSPRRIDQTSRILQILSLSVGIIATGAVIYSATR